MRLALAALALAVAPATAAAKPVDAGPLSGRVGAEVQVRVERTEGSESIIFNLLQLGYRVICHFRPVTKWRLEGVSPAVKRYRLPSGRPHMCCSLLPI